MSEFVSKVEGRPKKSYYYVRVPRKIIEKFKLKHKKPIKTTLEKNSKTMAFVTTVNFWHSSKSLAIIHLNRYVRNILNLEHGDNVKVSIEKPGLIKIRPKTIFKEGKIDYLAFVPRNIIVIENGKNLLLWRRPRTRAVEIRRFVELELSAKFLGLLFSEGQKCENTTGAYVSISNKKIDLHIETVNFLRKLLVHEELIRGYCHYDPELDNAILEKETKNYENATGVSVKPVKAKMYGSLNFLTNVNSTLIGEVILNYLNKICDYIIHARKFNKNLMQFSKKLIESIINGDGYLDISNSGVSLQIADEDKKRRTVVKHILNKLGLDAYDDGKLIIYCDVTGVDKRFELLNLGILNEKNKSKLMNSFAKLKFFNLQMGRLEKLLHINEFDNKTVREVFGWSSKKATKWLVPMVKRGYISKIGKNGYQTQYLINRAPNFQRYLELKSNLKS